MSIREDLKAYIDDELSPERATEVSAAIDQDPALREEYLFMKNLSGEIKSAATEPQVKGLDKAMGRVATPRFNFAMPRWASYSVAGLAVVMLIGFVGNLDGPLSISRILKVNEGLSSGPTGGAPTDGVVASPMAGDGLKPEDSIAAKNLELSTGAPQLRGGADDDAKTKSSPSFDNEQRQNAVMGVQMKKMPDSGRSRLNEGDVGGKGSRQGSELPPTSMSHDRKVIRTANMAIKVQNVAKAMSDTETQVAAMGGYVENTDFNQAEDGSVGTMNFQIPEKNFVAIVEYLGKAGTIVRNNKTGTDVTGEIAYTDGRIISLADEELNLIKELTRTRNSTDRLEIRSRLSSVRQEMRGLKEQNKATKNLAEMSRFVVNFEKSGQLDPAKADDWFSQTTTGAGNVLGFFGRIFGVGLIYTAFLTPIWLPIVGIFWWLKRRSKATV